MKLILKILLVLGVGALLGAVTAPFVHALLLRWLAEPFPYDKLLNRCVIFWLILFLALFRNQLFAVPLSQMGLRRGAGWRSELFQGLAFGLVSFVALTALYYFLGARRLQINLLSHKFLGRLIQFSLAAVFIGVFEEIFFRGFIFQALLQSSRQVWAVLISSLFYAFTHFLKPESFDVEGNISILDSLRLLVKFLDPLSHPEKVAPYFLGLFLLGVILCYAYIKTNRLYFSIGLHAIWVFCLKIDTFFVRPTHLGGEHWCFGDGRVINGIFGWEFLVLVLLLIHYFVPWRKKT